MLSDLLDAGDEAPPRRRRRRWPWLLLAALVLLAAVPVTAVIALQRHLDRNIERFGDPFAVLPQQDRPAKVVEEAQDFLLVGSDSRISAGDAAQWEVGAQRTDAIMLAHVPADRSGATVVSIPRDAWVEVPGHGRAKVNAAFSFGGPPLLVQTVEQLTGVHIDHLVVVDFEGFQQVTDALGGVDVRIPERTEDGYTGRVWQAGRQHMDGETALAYVRQRKGLPGGDFDRVKRQQNWLRAVLDEVTSRGTLADPVRLTRTLDATTEAIAVDDELSIGELRGLALSLRDVTGDDVSFTTAPMEGTGHSADGQSIVLLDEEAGRRLWDALAQDRVGPWLDEHRDDLLGRDVR